MPRKPSRNIKTETSMSFRTSVTRIVGLAPSRERVETYLGSDDFATAISRMNARDRLVSIKSAQRALNRFAKAEPIPEPLSQPRLRRWDAALQARFKEAIYRLRNDPRLPSLDEAVARELGMPITKVRPARWRLIGPIASYARGPGASTEARGAPVGS